MRGLIKADLRRVLRRPGLYVYLALVIIPFIIKKNADSAPEQIESMQDALFVLNITLIAVPIYMSVYADEFHTGSMQCAIGRGLTRAKLILAKLLDAAILLSGIFLVLFIIAFIKNTVSPLAITPRQNFHLFVYFLFGLIKLVAYFSVTSFLLFISWSVPLGMCSLVTMTLVLGYLLDFVQSKIDFPVYDYYIDGLIRTSYASFQGERLPWKLLIVLLFYIILPFFVSVKIFERKELEL